MIDASQFETRTSAENGVDVSVHFRGMDEPLSDEKGDLVYLKLLSSDGPVGRKAMREIVDVESNKKLSDAEKLDAQIEPTSRLIVGWSDNFTVDGQPYSKEAARKLAEIPVFRDFVVREAIRRENFFGKPSAKRKSG